MSRTLPTINDAHQAMEMIIDAGLADQPVQLMVVPDETLQALARWIGQQATDKPALMVDVGKLGFISTERLEALK
mgnify:CR=1 FL=1